MLQYVLYGFLLTTPFCLSPASAGCDGQPRQVMGTIYCDNVFAFYVNGEEVAKDPVTFTPHQAVEVSFEWDGTSDITYAIQCEDFASESGYEYVGTSRPQLGDGALIAALDDHMGDDGMGTVTSAPEWLVFVSTFGPTDTSIDAGCSAENLEVCVVEDRGTPNGWTKSEFDDSSWQPATEYTPAQAGWGRAPRWTSSDGCCGMTSPHDGSQKGCDSDVVESQCLNPRDEFAGRRAQFLWASDLERDNRVLFRYTATCSARDTRE